jgi:hypothetical protein
VKQIDRQRFRCAILDPTTSQAALLKEIDAWHEYVRIAKIEKI